MKNKSVTMLNCAEFQSVVIQVTQFYKTWFEFV